jgi:S-layer homology domain
VIGLRVRYLLGSCALAVFSAAILGAQTIAGVSKTPTTTHAPDEFGTQDYTVTTISATSFTPRSDDGSRSYYTGFNSPLGRGFLGSGDGNCLGSGELGEFYATVNIPSGAVIDMIGLDTYSPFDGAWGVALWQVDRYANSTLVASFSSSTHSFDTDYNLSPIGYQLQRNVHNELVLNVEEIGNGTTCPEFSFVEIWWHRTVSPPPASATFNDVPTSDSAFQFVEALVAAGITAGCGGGNYCPNAPLTRRQMAVFLSKALGLHWPY